MVPESLGEAEAQAKQRLNAELDEHLTHTEAAFNFICEAAAQVPARPLAEVPQSLKVSMALLSRISNDLRTASLLALSGYPTQALGIVASLYEGAFTIAYIGTDEGKAQRWLDHDDPTRPFQNVAELTRAWLANLGVPDLDMRAYRAYRAYSLLCMAKHANPLFQQRHGFRVVGGYIETFNGPDTSEHAIRGACFALDHAVGLSLIAVRSIISDHVPPEERTRLAERLRDLEEMRRHLEDKGIARWGTEDPFPGKWREI